VFAMRGSGHSAPLSASWLRREPEGIDDFLAAAQDHDLDGF